MAQGFGHIPEVDKGFGRNIREGYIRTIFQEGLKRKTDLEIINGKTKGKVRLPFTECLHLLGTASGSWLGESPCKGPAGTHFWLCRPASHVTTPGFCYCSTSSHS